MIYEFVNRICEFRQKHPVIRGKEIKSNDPVLNFVKKALNDLK